MLKLTLLPYLDYYAYPKLGLIRLLHYRYIHVYLIHKFTQ